MKLFVATLLTSLVLATAVAAGGPLGLSPSNKYGAPIPPWMPQAKPGWYYGKHPWKYPQYPCITKQFVCGLLARIFGFRCPGPRPTTSTPTPTATETAPTTTPTPPPSDGYTQVFDDLTGATQADNYMTFGLVDTIEDCKAMCNSVTGCKFINTYNDVNGKDGSTKLTCSLFSGCNDASTATNMGGQTQPDGSVNYIRNSDGFYSVRPRPRANTASFTASFSWRPGRQRTDQNTPSPPHQQPPAPSLSPSALIAALTPPAVPSLAHARSLAAILPTLSPLPRTEVLNPILAQLCTASVPASIQAAGYDVLSAFLENHEAGLLHTVDRVSLFALFIDPYPTWTVEIWEPRFKAFRSLTRYGTEISGMEQPIISVLKAWIREAFRPFMESKSVDRAERAERERSIDVLVKFFNDVLQQGDNPSRVTTDIAIDIIQFYADIVDDLITLDIQTQDHTPSDTAQLQRSQSHRRNVSSLSSSSTPSASSQPTPLTTPAGGVFKHPAELAIELYLRDLPNHLKILPPLHVERIFPLLFRILAFCATPLPRLAILQSRRRHTLEDRLSELLDDMLSGPYGSLCMRVLKFHLFPPGHAPPRLVNSVVHSGAHIYRHSPVLDFLTTLGAYRALRNYVRKALSARLARAYINQQTSMAYSHSGVPGHMDMESDLMEKAWPKEDQASSASANGWDAGSIGPVLAASVKAWVARGVKVPITGGDEKSEKDSERRDEILEEAAGIIKDVLQELDLREDDNAVLTDEEATAVGSTLFNLSEYVLPLRNPDGTVFIIPIQRPKDAPTPILRTISALLARDHTRPLNPLLSKTLVHVAGHLTDGDTASLPALMEEQHDLSPSSPNWIENWEYFLESPIILNTTRPKTRRAVMDHLRATYDNVKDMPTYRRPLADLVFRFCSGLINGSGSSDDADIMWKMVGEEIVLRSTDGENIIALLDLLETAATAPAEEEPTDVEDVLSPADTLSPGTLTTSPSSVSSPGAVRNPLDNRDSRDAVPHSVSVMSIFATFTGGSVSRSQSAHALSQEEARAEPPSPSPFENPLTPREVSASAALVEVFSQLVFTPHSLDPQNLELAAIVYNILLRIISEAYSPKAKLTVLQFLMRLRVDRDHRFYFVSGGNYDRNQLIQSLAWLINRASDPHPRVSASRVEDTHDGIEVRKIRPRPPPPEKDNRQVTRGRKLADTSTSGTSRSRSRTTAVPPPQRPPPLPKPLEVLWQIPEVVPFAVTGSDSPSEALVSYDPDLVDGSSILPVSQYLQSLILALEKETSWEIISYILCHLPVQLSNKHLFCGPKCRAMVSKLLTLLCTGLLSGDLASQIEQYPPGLKLRDIHGLVYHSLSVLVSYRRCFELQQHHLLVEVFQAGLDGQLSTIKCCLHALTLAAFELPSSMTRCLSRVLEKLSQIMSNPNMAVHILGFLSIIGSLPSLHANFTEDDFRRVFGVALQYLQHYNRQRASPVMSWALSQHVRILSYSAVYVWFLSLKLPDRPRHVRYITRQLLLANEDNDRVDSPTEVCFDWLARYTYATADPRPANSLFSDLVVASPTKPSTDEKTWLMGNAVITIRALERAGWVETFIRRPSGFTRFISHIENIPLVGPGDIAPDLVSVAAGLIMERDPSEVTTTVVDGESVPVEPPQENPVVSQLAFEEPVKDVPPPDPITGYVWSKTAPSQRRKQISLDPSFLFLQMSPLPDGTTKPFAKRVADSSALPRFLNMLDRIPVIDTHKVGILYVAPGQSNESEILANTHGSPAYTRFLEGLGRLINLRGQVDVYAGGLDPNEDGEYAYAWWDDIRQILYHTATMMPSHPHDPQGNFKKRHIGNDFVRIVWNDSGKPYRFDTLTTQFQFVNIVVEPHSIGSIAAFSNNIHEHEYFKVTMQLAPGMTEFAPIGHFKVISAENLPLLVRQLSLLADWFASVFSHTQGDTVKVEKKTNWHERLEAIRRFKTQLPPDPPSPGSPQSVIGQEGLRDFTTTY